MASQSSQIYYILDDTAEGVEYASESPSISVLFVGDHTGSGSFITTIDDNSSSSLSLTPPLIYRQFYQSPTLDDTAKIHIVNATGIGPELAHIELDYIAVSPGKETPLLGRTLMVDDMYSGLSFRSGWVTTETVFNLFSGTIYPALPFQNTTHTASTPGSMFSFSYTGSSLSLYGVFDWDQLGSYELTSTIDDELPVSKTFDARNDSNPEALQQQLNFLLFSTGELEAGTHTATFTLSKCANQTLIIDYITYKPSFFSLSTMPNLTGLTLPVPSNISTADPTSPTNPSLRAPNNSANSKSHIVPLVAGLVAGLALLACILLFTWRYWRRQNRPLIPVTSDEQTLSIEPFHSIFQSAMRPRRQKQPIALPSNQENVSGEKAGRPRSGIPDAGALEAMPAQVDQQDLEDSNEVAGVAVVSRPNRRPSFDGLDPVQIAMTRRMQMQEEQIQAMRAELDALARPPDYQST